MTNHDPLLEDLATEFEEAAGFQAAGVTDDETQSALDELEREAQMVPELAEGGVEDEAFGAAGVGMGPLSLEALTVDPQADMQFLTGWLRKKVLRILRNLVALVRRYGSRVRNCIRLVTRAIQLFRQGKLIAALRAAYQAFRCVRQAV
jgi:hypothetical protein